MIFTKDEFIKKKNVFLKKVKDGAVFIYPTDTIYGIGCDARNKDAVQKIRELKNRDKKPFSIIVPSIEWISENCSLSNVAKKWLLKLPGPYTLIVPLNNHSAVCSSTNSGLNSIGVRFPKHWFTSFVESLDFPIVTTSVNLSGKPPASSLDELKAFNVDFIIYDGELKNNPSVVVDLTKGENLLKR